MMSDESIDDDQTIAHLNHRDRDMPTPPPSKRPFCVDCAIIWTFAALIVITLFAVMMHDENKAEAFAKQCMGQGGNPVRIPNGGKSLRSHSICLSPGTVL